MSGIVLSASVRQNLLSLQSTADLLATTQNRLATGKKVNTALDNPTNYLHRAGPRQPRQRHQQPARRHRQRRAGAAGRQHRHHLAAEAGRQRQVDRQPGAADPGRLLAEVQCVVGRRSPAPPRTICSAPAPIDTVTGTAANNDLTARRRSRRDHAVRRCQHGLADLGTSRPPTRLVVNGKTITFDTAQRQPVSHGRHARIGIWHRRRWATCLPRSTPSPAHGTASTVTAGALTLSTGTTTTWSSRGDRALAQARPVRPAPPALTLPRSAARR